MKRILFFLIGLFFQSQIWAQVEVHTKESIGSSKKEIKVGEEVELIFNIKIDKDWYVYSSELKVEGPLPATFTFKPNNTYQTVGKIKPIGFKTKYDEV